jgi:peptide/nickel transport system substrate-binding protein
LRGGKEMIRIVRTFIIFLLVAGLNVLLTHGNALGSVKLRSTIVADPINLDPALLYETQDRIVVQQIYQGLVTFDCTVEPPYPVVPVLAKSYEVSEDGKMITLKLRKGVQFHHGYGELTSEDVVFSLKRHQDPKIASRAKAQFRDVERIEAPDKYSVRIHLKDSSAFSLIRNLAWQTGGFILSKKAALKLGDKVARKPIGTGPYYFDRWEPGEKVVLKKFDKYWRTPARIDEIEFWCPWCT